MGRRQQLALTIILAGVLLPVAIRFTRGPTDARLALPLATIALAVGALLWFREVPGR